MDGLGTWELGMDSHYGGVLGVVLICIVLVVDVKNESWMSVKGKRIYSIICEARDSIQ